ncbi:MAG: lipopolysaccharide biosynthesis protein [Deltaproteobacteria bacterium]|nr:lipopolysaccharide biosynthesis protein [Deltaproteobacteria bacterium]
MLLLAASLAPSARALATPEVLSDGSPGARLLEARLRLDRRVVDAAPPQIWVLGATPSPAAWHRILARVRDGARLLFVPGSALPDLGPLGLRAGSPLTQRASLAPAPSATGPLVEQAVWPTAPQTGLRVPLSVAGRTPLRPIVLDPATRTPLLLVGPLGRGRVAVFGLSLTDPSNRDLLLWPYFGYLGYALGCELLGLPTDRFADWPYAPVPSGRTAWLLGLGIALAWALTMALFVKARRYSRAHPELLARFFHTAPASPGAAPPRTLWHAVGFTRPLAGFLTLAAILFVLFAPFYWLNNIFIPNRIQPFPQAKGIWDFAWEALQVAWFLFDAGTFVAFVKYFAEYRLKDPAEAVKSAQFFIWWQILTGLVQVSLAVLAATLILPRTRYGYSSNFVMLVALGQYPGFFGVVTFFFQAYQRFDYNIGLDLLSDWLLRFVLQIPCVLLFRAWGARNPEYGEAFGAAVGIGVGFYVSTVVTFLVGLVLYRRLGLRITPLVLAHFDRKTAWRMLSYGLRVVSGQLFFRMAKTVERVVISLLLINYTEWLGLESQIHYNLMFLFPVAYRFFETAMAALSESHGNDKPVLTQYYLARFFQVGSLYSAIGLSLLVALGPTFVRHAMDPQWARAAEYLVIAAVIGAFFAPAWLSDMLQKGAGRPGLFAIALGVEQALRIGLFYLFIPRWQFMGFYLALLGTIALKVCGAWLVNHLFIVRVRLFLWPMFVAPALAGLANFALLRGLAALLPFEGRWEVTAIFFAASLLSFLVCLFACGLAGGYDAVFLEELDVASRMTGALKPLTRLFYGVARAGARLSPLHGRFPVRIAAEARAEAEALEAQHRGE